MSMLERYSRQILLPQIGKEGQERLLSSAVAIIGCGALGTVIASSVVRAGVGLVKIVDRDYVELNNLQRQILFDEDDVARQLPKAVAAATKLRRINSNVQIEPVVTDVDPGNVEGLIQDVDLVLDGTDNFATRFLINDACIKHGIAWVYAAVVATHGLIMAIIPHRTPCLRCLLTKIPEPGSVQTCDTVGVLGTAVNIVASLEVTEGLKILMGKEEDLHRQVLYVDVWSGTLEPLELLKDDRPCPTCDLGSFEFLDARMGPYVTALCGRNAVQVKMCGEAKVPFAALAERLRSVGQVTFNEYMLRFQVDGYELTVFPDGRAIIKGTADKAEARSLYARYIGS